VAYPHRLTYFASALFDGAASLLSLDRKSTMAVAHRQKEKVMATAAQIVDISKLISRSPKVYHGLPVIAGTRIPVMIIVGMEKEGIAASEIARQKYLDPAQVHAAIAYCYANRQLMDSEIAEEEAENERIANEWRLARKSSRPSPNSQERTQSPSPGRSHTFHAL